MAKQTHAENKSSSSRNTLIVMSIGALLVVGLVGWALTRTVEPAPSVMANQEQFPTSTVATTPSSAPAVSDTNATPATNTLSPIAGTTAPVTFTSDVAPPAPSEHSQSPEKAAVPRIAAEDLRERVNAGSVVVIDVRDANSYAQGHIAGALSMPFATVEGQLDAIPKGKQIVTYCT
jgi:hypothetical protein